MTRTSMLTTAAAVAAALGLGGWAAGALHPSHAAASDGRTLQLRYEVRRPPAYAPPPPTEAARIDVLNPQAPTTVEEGVLSAQSGEALRSLQTEDAARTTAALATVRADDARVDRETAAALDDTRDPDLPADQRQPPAA